MEAIALIALILVVVVFVLPIVAMSKASRAQRAVDVLEAKVRDLQDQIHNLRSRRPAATDQTASAAAEGVEPETPAPRAQPATPVSQVPPPLPAMFPQLVAAKVPSRPPPTTVAPTRSTAATSQPPPPHPAINWEQFMGAKLFAWVGGLALFLGVAFFVKYSFEHNLIPPEVRVAIGFVVGLALMVGGLALKRKENAVTAQTLCATGILILYAVTFACHSYYHFSFFGVIPTFALMTLITATAFLLAVRMDAVVIAILGIAGGFLTPVLLSTGQDNPLGLFGYIALLDVGLLAVARRKEWIALPILGAIGTVIMQVTWAVAFFEKGHYFAGNNIFTPMAVFLGFEVLFLAALAATKRGAKSDDAISGSAIAIAAFAILWGFFFLSFNSLGTRPIVLLSYIFLADIGLLAIVFLREKLGAVSGVAGLVVFVFLGIWTGRFLTNHNLYVALGAYFIFAILHATAPMLLQRLRKVAVPWWCHAFPALALLLVLMPIFNLPEVSFLVWPLVLCVDLLAIVLAVVTGTLFPVFIVLLLTFGVVGGWIFRIPAALTGLPASLSLLGGFAIFFLAASVWAARHLLARIGKTSATGTLFGNLNDPANFAVQLPALSATLPFLLLIMVTLRLQLADPSAVFSLALLLIVLLLGMSKLLSLDALPAVGLASILALEHAWHGQHFNLSHADVALTWYLSFTAIFTVFPFLFHKQFANKTLVWAVAALAAPLHFFLIYSVMRSAFLAGMLGVVPATLAIPSLLGLIFLIKRTPLTSAARNAQLALFGGAALFFITLIFPIQFDRQWITVGWALEGAALCWLFWRVPHPGLRIAGVALLVVAFVRLALNPAVLTYHPHAAMPIVNWYFYTYGIAIAAMFFAAQLLEPPRNLVLGHNAPPVLYTLGTILCFLLLNIEIADYFSAPGTSALTFQFSGNFGRDMTYSIAWAGFALLLLIIGIQKTLKPVRYASLALLGVAVLKLFLHDLSQLDQLYRIAALVVVAIIAMLASFLYQRFLGIAPKPAQ